MKSVLRTTALAAATLAALGAASSAFAGGRADLVAQGLAQGKPHVADQLIVQFRSGATEDDKQRAMRRVNGERGQSLVRGNRRVDIGGDVDLIVVRGQARIADAIAALRGDGAVDFVEPNWILQHAAVSNDTYYTNGSLWGMYSGTSTPANQYGSGAANAWTSGTSCSNVVVGIIDEGYMHGHTDLAANAFKNPLDSTFDGVDNDGNGYVDDVYGWDFAGNNNSVFDGVADGVQFCLSQFEAGQDGERLLDELPLSFVKLARKYTTTATSSILRDEVKVLIDRSHRRGLEVIGHGVEDAQAAATLWMSGIDFIQGNLVQQADRGMDFDFQQAVL